MLLNKVLKFFKSYKKGTYTTIEKQTIKDGYKKIVFSVIRFVNYYNIKENKMQNKTPLKKVNYERVIIPHILKENLNTKNYLLLCYPTKNHKPKTQYFCNDKPITGDQYYAATKEKRSDIKNIFCVKIDDIKRLGACYE